MFTNNELRIGNFIFAQNKLIEVDFLNKLSIGWGNGNFAANDWHCFNAIPIDKDWLLKFGFTEQTPLGQRTFFAYGNLTVEICSDNDCAIYFNATLLCFCKYIHQLQNIVFSLFQIEMPFKPLKYV